MEEQITNAIQALAKNLGIAANEIYPHYAGYYAVQSGAYIILGIVLIIVGIYLIKTWKKYKEKDELAPIISMVGAVIIFIMAALFIFCNIGDMVKPQAAAYHQLIKDLQPLKK